MSVSVQPPAVLRLREQIQRLEGVPLRTRTVLPFGIEAIDGRLPEGGLALGALHEVAGGGNAAIDGAAAALFAAGIAARTKGKVLWCITRQERWPRWVSTPTASSTSTLATRNRSSPVSRRVSVTEVSVP